MEYGSKLGIMRIAEFAVHTHTGASTLASDLSIADFLQRLRSTFGERAPSYYQLRAAVAEGRIPAHKHGREWRIGAADLERARVGLRLPARPWVA